MKKLLYSFIAVAAIGISCEKIDSIPVRYTPIPGSNTNVKFLILSPDAPGVNIFANGIKSTATAANASADVVGFAFPSVYPSTIGYATLPSGSVTIVAKVPDSTTVMPGAEISTSTHTFAANKFYTFALVDSMHKISTVVIEDDPSVPDPSKAYYRVANFVSNGSSVKVEIARTTGATYPFPVVATYDPAFKSATAFEPFPETGSYRIYLKHPTTGAKLDSISSFTPTATKKYTIYTRGVLGLTGTNAKRPIITSYTNF